MTQDAQVAGVRTPATAITSTPSLPENEFTVNDTPFVKMTDFDAVETALAKINYAVSFGTRYLLEGNTADMTPAQVIEVMITMADAGIGTLRSVLGVSGR